MVIIAITFAVLPDDMETASNTLLESSFKTVNGHIVSDLMVYVMDWLSAHPQGRVFIGTDSKVYGSSVVYATVICMWDVGKGVHEVYRKQRFKKPKDRFTRLWNEVVQSVEIAEQLAALGPIEIHMDFNSNPKYQSAGMGLITSMGFIGAGKPMAWAATSGANRHCQ